jgi:peptidoglycan-associated lipoprotein
MKKELHISSILLLCILMHITASAQRKATGQAGAAFKNKEYYEAAALYKKALPDIRSKDQRAQCVFMIAECYRSISAYKEAESWYGKAALVNYPDPIIHLHRAEALSKEEKYPEAILEFNRYQALVPSNPAAELGIKSAVIAQKWKDVPSRYHVDNMVQINSRDYDFSPFFLDRKKTTLVFTSRREGSTGGTEFDKKTGLLFTDLFYSHVDKNGKWEAPRPFPTPINTGANEGSCWLNAKGDKMYFTRCERNKNRVMRCHILVSSKKGGDNWTDPVAINFSQDDYSKFDFRHPALSPDENIMVFQSDVEALEKDSTLTEPNTDLYISRYDKKSETWSKPENLGPGINTLGKEGFPYIRQDGNLYYSSDGMLGMGGLDIFMAEKISKDQWAWKNPVNLKAPLNSAGDDFGIIFEGSKDIGYFSSNREGGKGKDDIWSFNLEPLVLNVEGLVADCEHKDSVPNAVVRMVGSDGSSVEQKTGKDGRYAFPLRENVSYILNVFPTEASSKITYFNLPEADRKKISTVSTISSTNYQADFCLKRIPPIIVFPRVEYGLDSANLRPTSKDSLDFVYRLLTDNPSLVIELAAHTDSRGTVKHNLDLSQRRAEACYRYLVEEKKINPKRILPKGYAQLHVLVSDADIAKLNSAEKREEAHQKNRRTVIRVLSTTFSDPNAPAVNRSIVPAVGGEQEKYGEDN